MFRFFKVTATVVGFLIFSSGKLRALTELGKKDQDKMEEESLRIVRKMFVKILKMAGVEVTVKGYEKIPKDRPVLYVGNHRSYFDILVGYTTVPGRVGFIAKKEMEKIPLLSGWMINVNCLFLDRKNIKEGLKTILAGVEKIKRGVSVWIFPEGTRNRNSDPKELLPFKEGSLKIAEKSGCPVVPVAITGTADIFEKHIPYIIPGKVTIEFGDPIFLKELPPEERKFAGAYTRKRIIEMLEKEN
ncbi:MAG: 1-acyl-sn-glycerol-3-phosphate acyltransferase [Clostridium sp.]|nr:1-acyl-sn-glycerol-3-phosphate acyltransferase [Clostridium sp.]